MNPEDTAKFKKLLEDLLDETTSSFATTDSSTESITPDNAIGRLTRMEAIQAQSISAEGKRRLELRIRAIQVALDHLEAGEYGVCAVCGDEIPMGRLEFRPESRLCVACANRSFQ